MSNKQNDDYFEKLNEAVEQYRATQAELISVIAKAIEQATETVEQYRRIVGVTKELEHFINDFKYYDNKHKPSETKNKMHN